MIRKLLAAAALALAVAAPATAEPRVPTPPPAFDLVVRAPDPLRDLLEKNLELRRYREVSDLDDAEIARLIVLAEKDARELLATQGYFAPQVRIAREPGPRTTLVVTVDAGERARVTAADVQFEGDIATSTDADAIGRVRKRATTPLRMSSSRPTPDCSATDSEPITSTAGIR